jgi:hypothetical protein
MIAKPGIKVGKKHFLKLIKECTKKSETDNKSFKRICVYYSGHSNKSGNWVLPDGEITLKDICH